VLNKFKTLRSTAVPLAVENIDTDQIIPARFLKAVERKGFGDNLFRDWRFDKNNQPITSFSLNDSKYSGKILIAAKNFGCGSSREHAAWAIYDYGFRVVISSYFADIFKNNALNNGLLPIQISDEQLKYLMNKIEEKPETLLEINLEQQKLIIIEDNISWPFDITAYKKECMIEGYDDFSYLHSRLKEIESFENFRLSAF
jgi:3-isopropylmalate/(R)-2-methylmalate dehydratase small subunit